MSLAEKTTEAAGASLDRLFHRFGDADDDRWRKVIERARGGAEHPLEALEYSGKTEEHPVCSAVLESVGSGKKGKEIRSHFSGPPFGWPRDAIDAALISLFGAGHLRASANGVALQPKGLDQGKVANTDFRVESATIDTRQRLKLRSLFQTAGIECKPNEESEAAGRLLRKLGELAREAGGGAPLPERPDTRHLSDLESLAGNEQLLGILDQHDELSANLEDWTGAGSLAAKRLPALERLQTLARHADGLDAGREARPQIEAIVADRRLLVPSDPVPGLAASLTNALRTELAESQNRYDGTYGEELKLLEETESWRQIQQQDRDAIFVRLRISRADDGRHRQRAGSSGVPRAHLPRRLADAHGRPPQLDRAGQGGGGQACRTEDPSREAGEPHPANGGGGGRMGPQDRAGSHAAGRAGAHRHQVKPTATRRIVDAWRISRPTAAAGQEPRVQHGWTCKLRRIA